MAGGAECRLGERKLYNDEVVTDHASIDIMASVWNERIIADCLRKRGVGGGRQETGTIRHGVELY